MPCFSDYGRADKDCYDDLRAATRAGCEMARLIRKQDDRLPPQHKAITLKSRLSKETLEWIRQHDKQDRERIKREKEEKKRKKLKKQALKKLSKKEREALNLR